MLRITKQTDYGIVLLARLADSGDTTTVQNARDLAHATSLPLPTVSKILKALARGGLLQSHRGVKGGYSLARDANEISVEEVIRALEGPIAITECLEDENDDCGIQASCPCRANWQKINDAVREALQGISLSDMAAANMFPTESTTPTPTNEIQQ